ncbi:MAG: methyltransferase domain-containing protein [Phycisphaerae bacterium]
MATPMVLDEYKQAIAKHFDARTDYTRSKTHARLANRLVRLAAPQPDERVLDIATGTGFVAIPAAQLVGKRGTVVGVDISSGMVAQARKNVAQASGSAAIEIIEAAAASLPFPDDSFEAVVSTGVMHHWKDPAADLNEIHRVLKPGGYALLYDLVRKLPPDVAQQARRDFGRVRFTLLWLHSFEEPFYEVDELRSLPAGSKFSAGDVRFVGVLCCLVLKKD